jgi:hypothetical protein
MTTETPIPPALHELEEAVSEGIWGHDERRVRRVMESLNGRNEPRRAYTTYKTIMPKRFALHTMLLPRNKAKVAGGGTSSPSSPTSSYAAARTAASVRLNAESRAWINTWKENSPTLRLDQAR